MTFDMFLWKPWLGICLLQVSASEFAFGNFRLVTFAWKSSLEFMGSMEPMELNVVKSVDSMDSVDALELIECMEPVNLGC